MIQELKLKDKKNLTHNVFLMTFKWEKKIEMKPGQFITFLLEWLWWRAYSILEIKWNEIVLIIKKRELSEWWRWWSKHICELRVWDTLKWVGPAWHFLLQENTKNKLFIWTGTWLVPLYNMINYQLNIDDKTKIEFIFWVREESDIFYLDKLKELKNKHNNFNFHIYISRVKDLYDFKLNHQWKIINSWYTTNFLTRENIKEFHEIYICWAPTMIESSIDKLKKINFNTDDIYFEKY